MQGYARRRCLVCGAQSQRRLSVTVCACRPQRAVGSVDGESSSGHRVHSDHQQGNLPDAPCCSICSDCVCLMMADASPAAVWDSRTSLHRKAQTTRKEVAENKPGRCGGDNERKEGNGEDDNPTTGTQCSYSHPLAQQITLSYHWSCLAVNWRESIRMEGLCGWISWQAPVAYRPVTSESSTRSTPASLFQKKKKNLAWRTPTLHSRDLHHVVF